MNPRASLRHIRFGIHSRIPLCCVAEWVLLDALEQVGIGSGPSSARCDRIAGPRIRAARYIPCTACCLAIRAGVQHPALVHICTPDDDTCDEWTAGLIYLVVNGELLAHAKVAS